MFSFWPPPVPATTAWPDVAVAAIYAVPATLATVFGYLIHRAIRTPSGPPIGQQVEATRREVVNGAKLPASPGGEGPQHGD